MLLLGVPLNVGCPCHKCQSPRLHLFTFNAISLVLLVKCLEHVNIQSERFSAPCTFIAGRSFFFYHYGALCDFCFGHLHNFHVSFFIHTVT